MPWFEIGRNINTFIDYTESVFVSDSLMECLKVWLERKYSEPDYFIDVCEKDRHDCPVSIARIPVNNDQTADLLKELKGD